MSNNEPPQKQENKLELLYVKLDPNFTKDLTWSNDPRDLQLDGIFRKDAPNLASDFNVDGLLPVQKEGDGDIFILKDPQDVFYLWNEWDGHLWKVDEWWTKDEELRSIEDMVENIMCHIGFVQKGAQKVFKTYK